MVPKILTGILSLAVAFLSWLTYDAIQRSDGAVTSLDLLPGIGALLFLVPISMHLFALFRNAKHRKRAGEGQ